MSFFKTKTGILIIVIIVSIIGILIARRGGDAQIETVMATRGNISEEVSVTGRVEPLERVNLSFETGGRVDYVAVDVGERVFRGSVLAALSNIDIRANKKQAEAVLSREKAALAELLVGSRNEEIAVEEAKVAAAQSFYFDSKESLANSIRNAYSKSDDAVRNRVDQFMSNTQSTSPSIDFQTENKLIIESGRVEIENILSLWNDLLLDISLESDLRRAIEDADKWISKVQSFLNTISIAVNGLKVSSAISQTTIDGWRSDISTARANVQTARDRMATDKESLNTREADLLLKKNQLVLKKALATDEEIEKQEAKIAEAEAGVLNQEAVLAKTLIIAPISGIVTTIDINPGEIVTVNTTVINLISDGGFEIKAFVPEADISKLSLGDSARITLDAYGDSALFIARVSAIDPAETIVDGVSTYKTTLQFDEPEDKRIRSGMTANIDIETNKKDNVIIIPLKAVAYGIKGDSVRVLSGGLVKDIPIQTGIESQEGMVEIISGISEGDEIITYIK